MNKEAQFSPVTCHASRISIITETYLPEINGVAHTLSQFIRELTKKGVRVQLIRPKPEATPNPADLPADYHEVASAPLPGYNGLKVGLATPGQISSLLKGFAPDAVYIATEGPLGLSALVAAKTLKLPALTGFHTNFHTYAQHYKLKALASAGIWYMKRFHNVSSGTLVPTQLLKDELSQLGFKKLGVVGRGVNTSLFSPNQRCEALRASWGVKPHEPVLIHVGRVAAEKNIEQVLTTYKQLRTDHPNLKLVLVGDGPLKSKLEQLYPEVIFTGAKRGFELYKHYASADVFVFASQSETFGNVVTEAMASGLAVSGYKHAALAQLGVHQQNAMITELESPYGLYEHTNQLLQDPELLKQVKQGALETSRAHSWGAVANQFHNKLKQLQQQGGRYEPSYTLV